MKHCSGCDTTKDVDDFYKDSSSKDGLDSWCKLCRRAIVKKYEESEAGKAVRKKYNTSEARKTSSRKYNESEAGKAVHIKAAKRWNEKNPLKVAAHEATTKAIIDGDIEVAPCEVCGEEKAEAHHDDYSKQLDVRFLCSQHHNDWHRLNGEGANG